MKTSDQWLFCDFIFSWPIRQHENPFLSSKRDNSYHEKWSHVETYEVLCCPNFLLLITWFTGMRDDSLRIRRRHMQRINSKRLTGCVQVTHGSSDVPFLWLFDLKSRLNLIMNPEKDLFWSHLNSLWKTEDQKEWNHQVKLTQVKVNQSIPFNYRSCHVIFAPKHLPLLFILWNIGRVNLTSHMIHSYFSRQVSHDIISFSSLDLPCVWYKSEETPGKIRQEKESRNSWWSPEFIVFMMQLFSHNIFVILRSFPDFTWFSEVMWCTHSITSPCMTRWSSGDVKMMHADDKKIIPMMIMKDVLFCTRTSLWPKIELHQHHSDADGDKCQHHVHLPSNPEFRIIKRDFYP